MPESTTVAEVPPPPAVTVVETVTVSEFPTPSPPPPPPEDLPPPTAVLEPEVNDSLRALIDDMNAVSDQIEGVDSSGVMVLDPDQFTALGFAFLLVVALLAAIFIVSLRR